LREVARSTALDESRFKEASIDDLNSIQLKRYQAQKYVSHPRFKTMVVGSYVRFAQTFANPNSEELKTLIAQGKMSLYRIGRIHSVVHTGTPYAIYNKDELPAEARDKEKERDRMKMKGQVSTVLSRVSTTDLVLKTDLAFVVEIGSDKGRLNIKDDDKKLRVVRIKDLSNHKATQLEYDLLKLRLAQNYAETKNLLDRPLTRGDVLQVREYFKKHEKKTDMSQEEFTRLKDRKDWNTFKSQKGLVRVINPTIAKAGAEQKKQNLLEELERLKNMEPHKPESFVYHKQPTDEPGNIYLIWLKKKDELKKLIENQTSYIAELEADELRRREKVRNRDIEILKNKDKGISSLTHVVNIELQNANRERMRAAADIERVKDDKAAQAEVDENPFMRRRTIPTNLYAVKRATTAATDASITNAPTSSSQPQANASSDKGETNAQTSGKDEDDLDLGLFQPVSAPPPTLSTSTAVTGAGVSWAEYKARMKK
jgi:hypothetical protein